MGGTTSALTRRPSPGRPLIPSPEHEEEVEGGTRYAQKWKAHLEEDCIEWLQRYLKYRKETLLRTGTSSSSSSPHSLRYFYTGVSEPGQGLPQFIAVGYVNGQLFVQYDSNTKRTETQATWMEKVTEEDPQYWERNTQIARRTEELFRVDMETVRNYYNLSKGFHTWQLMYGCELRPDGSTGGYEQFAYDGRDHISFDKETLTWTATDPIAQKTKRKWEREPAIAQYSKAYLEKECIEWLQRHLKYGKETLLRTGVGLDDLWEHPSALILSNSVSAENRQEGYRAASIDQCRWKRVECRASLRIETPKTDEHAGFGTRGRNGAASGSRLVPGGADRPLLSLR
ncbi:hypothetical protein JRQ81_012239, partial [Phrynocephalus forsythii]